MKFTTETSRAANAIKHSKRCIIRWQNVIAENIMSHFTGSAWSMIVRHKDAIQKEKAHIAFRARFSGW